MPDSFPSLTHPGLYDTVVLLQQLSLSMANIKFAMLSTRYPHVEPVDPTLTSLYVQDNFVSGYISIALLTLVVYNACNVVKILSKF